MLTNNNSLTGRANIQVSWWMIGASMSVGGILGLWSFAGPLPAPTLLTEYDSVPRRLVRLAHIAAIALPILNLLFVPYLEKSGLCVRAQSRACASLLLGTCLLPLCLVSAALWPPSFYLLPVPVFCLMFPIFSLAFALSKRMPSPKRSLP